MMNSSYFKVPLIFVETSVVRLLYTISAKHWTIELSILRCVLSDLRTSATLR